MSLGDYPVLQEAEAARATIKGVNNIVAGNRKIPGTKYVIYQGPQYVNG